MLRRALEKEGWQVSEADNGRVALDRMAEQVPSLILLDLMMPVMDGFGFLSKVREHERWHALPIIVVTAKDLSSDERAHLAGNVQGLLEKGSYDRQQLLERITGEVAGYLEPGPDTTEGEAG